MSKMTARFCSHRHRQTGVALVASLVIMLVLTILGVTVMNMTSLEEKMAFNTQDRYLARYLAESSVLLQAVETGLPSPNQPGVSSRAFTLTSANIPKLESASGQITYMESTASRNLPMTNPRVQQLTSGAGDDNFPVYQIFVTANTSAGTTARLRAGYYWMPRNKN